MQRIGAVAYRIQLPEEMSDIHNVFHVPQLKKCLRVSEEQISLDTIDLQDDLRYQEVPIKILDTVTKQTTTKTYQSTGYLGKRRCPDEKVSPPV